MLAWLWLGGCCGEGEPAWRPLPPVNFAGGEETTLDLGGYVDAGPEVTFTAAAPDGLTAVLADGILHLASEPWFEGTASVTLTATGRCGVTSTSALVVTVDPALAAPCPTVLRYTARTAPERVFVAGAFNAWSATATPLARVGEAWEVVLDLTPGLHPYKIVETTGTEQQWACDPGGAGFQCDAGALFDASCPVGGAGCNSLLEVPACGASRLEVTSVAIDRAANRVAVEVVAAGEVASPTATLDGVPLSDAWTGAGFSVSLGDLDDGRHTLRFGGSNVEPVTIAAWLDDRTWETGLLYFAFVDRFENGDPTNDDPVGATAPGGDYAGGDWAGLTSRLDWLDSLGVTALWLTAPIDNPAGASSGDCGVTYSGYHGYWPSSEQALESHFGDADDLRALVDSAHARGIRVLVDLVVNHVHSDHPWATERPDWFTEPFTCSADEDGDGVANWDQRPETCWFTGYLPDLDYTRTDVIDAMASQAIALVRDHDLDGFRIDAVKHMSHGLHATLQTRIAREIELTRVGGDEPFYTVGETFTGDRGLIASYVNPAELDGQFDFPLYWGILGAFARSEIGLSNGAGSLMDVSAASRAAFSGGLMSTFLGNHDVARFVAHASGDIVSLYGDGTCAADGGPRDPDQPPADADPYDRLRMAWSFLLTTPGLPLIYYGDEIGLPGHADPDNRQVMRFEPDLSPDEATVLAHVRALGTARRDHPAFALGTTVDWWENEADFWAYARTWDEDAVLVLLNRAGSERVVTNGLAFAGLAAGTWEDVLTGDRFTSAGDALTVEVPARGSRVLVFAGSP